MLGDKIIKTAQSFIEQIGKLTNNHQVKKRFLLISVTALIAGIDFLAVLPLVKTVIAVLLFALVFSLAVPLMRYLLWILTPLTFIMVNLKLEKVIGSILCIPEAFWPRFLLIVISFVLAVHLFAAAAYMPLLAPGLILARLITKNFENMFFRELCLMLIFFFVTTIIMKYRKKILPVLWMFLFRLLPGILALLIVGFAFPQQLIGEKERRLEEILVTLTPSYLIYVWIFIVASIQTVLYFRRSE